MFLNKKYDQILNVFSLSRTRLWISLEYSWHINTAGRAERGKGFPSEMGVNLNCLMVFSLAAPFCLMAEQGWALTLPPASWGWVWGGLAQVPHRSQQSWWPKGCWGSLWHLCCCANSLQQNISRWEKPHVNLLCYYEINRLRYLPPRESSFYLMVNSKNWLQDIKLRLSSFI